MSSSKTILFPFLIAASFIASSACTRSSSPKNEVNLAIWGNYLSEDARRQFTETTGIRLNVTHYSSNEELLAKIQAGRSGIDVAVPSDYMVDVMIKLNLLAPLDKGALPHAAELDPDLLSQSYDPTNDYSLPYAWSTTGIAINRKLHSDPVRSWKDLFENPKLSGKIALLDDAREVAAAVLKMQGHGVNTTDTEVLASVEKKLLEIKKHVRMFSSESVAILKNREVAAAQAYSTDALQAAAQMGGDIEYVIPEEGAVKAIDNLVILKEAPNKTQAHQLVNFLIAREQNRRFVETIRAGPVVKNLRRELADELKNHRGLFPDNKTLDRLERLRDLGEKNSLYEELWMKVKTSSH